MSARDDKKKAEKLKRWREIWRQENPRDEIIAVLASVRGALDNLRNGVLTSREQFEKRTAKMDDEIEQAIYLTRLLEEGKWPDGIHSGAQDNQGSGHKPGHSDQEAPQGEGTSDLEGPTKV